MNLSGKFISFEGIDGCGKSTQAKILSTKLTDCGNKVLLTREPGGSEGAEEIRNLLLKVIQIDGQQKLKYYYSPLLGVIIWSEPFYPHLKLEQLLFVIVFQIQQGFTKV